MLNGRNIQLGIAPIGLLGAIIMGVIRNGLNLMNVSTYLQKLIIGVIANAARKSAAENRPVKIAELMPKL